MSRSGANPPSRPGAPQAAHDALLGGAAGDPVRRALWLDALDLRLRSLLAPSLTAHARLANVDGARLVYLVDSPVWHARLRLASPELLDCARSIGLDVAELVIKTTTQPLHPRVPMAAVPAPATPLSPTARDALQAVLASLADDDASGTKGGS